MKGQFGGAVTGCTSWRIKNLMLMIALVALLTGCFAKSKAHEPVFFPPPPEEPHIQYLTGATSSLDFGSNQSSLSKLLVGGAETVTRLAKPYGIAEHKGKIYVCDTTAGQIVVVDFINKTMKNLIDERGVGKLRKPVSVAVDDEGYVYVADTGRKDVAVYNPAGKYVKSYGSTFEHVSMIGVAVHGDDLYILDNRLGKVFVLNRKTAEVQTVIGDNPDRTKNLSLPNGLTVDSKGMVRVVNVGNGTVKEYDRDGNMLSVFGRLGDSPGEFTRPRGVAVDDDRQVFVVDGGYQLVQVFDEKHRILGYFGAPGLPVGSLNLPAGIVVSRDNLDFYQKFAAPGFKLREVIFVSNQYSSPFNHALAVFGLGEMEGWEQRAAQRAKEDAEVLEKRKKLLQQMRQQPEQKQQPQQGK
ncbi:SMP-30/gluconolactonase/LRE family protein [Geomonas anaerohicana]|uniref:SMP-30/gluconolactonase/LRE family protein n=1 Tax=Geomonas anaerohicana TaxID=2798583 RepID=A0ABS0YH57_9BACT|nr:SMP-30/gluconolactonase/LRE family protein [Geomonas anaerohicana]MBJ6751596.1 SMP-30/gluconolactonase/LRE family protein [Geomonas anaerohicana]